MSRIISEKVYISTFIVLSASYSKVGKDQIYMRSLLTKPVFHFHVVARESSDRSNTSVAYGDKIALVLI